MELFGGVRRLVIHEGTQAALRVRLRRAQDARAPGEPVRGLAELAAAVAVRRVAARVLQVLEAGLGLALRRLDVHLVHGVAPDVPAVDVRDATGLVHAPVLVVGVALGQEVSEVLLLVLVVEAQGLVVVVRVHLAEGGAELDQGRGAVPGRDAVDVARAGARRGPPGLGHHVNVVRGQGRGVRVVGLEGLDVVVHRLLLDDPGHEGEVLDQVLRPVDPDVAPLPPLAVGRVFLEDVGLLAGLGVVLPLHIEVGHDLERGDRLADVHLDEAARLVGIPRVVLPVHTLVLLALPREAGVVPVLEEALDAPLLLGALHVLADGIDDEGLLLDVEEDLPRLAEVRLADEREGRVVRGVNHRLGHVPDAGEEFLLDFVVLGPVNRPHVRGAPGQPREQPEPGQNPQALHGPHLPPRNPDGPRATVSSKKTASYTRFRRKVKWNLCPSGPHRAGPPLRRPDRAGI